jgi:serine/threonine-protein kinase
MTPDDLIGHTLAGHRLIKHVGEGGTALVYKAEHPSHGPTAIKVLRPRLGQDPIAVKRFLREAEFGVRVVHPNVVRTWEYGEQDGAYFLALEWAEGEALELFAAARASWPRRWWRRSSSRLGRRSPPRTAATSSIAT